MVSTDFFHVKSWKKKVEGSLVLGCERQTFLLVWTAFMFLPSPPPPPPPPPTFIFWLLFHFSRGKCHCSGQRNACSHLNPVPIFNFCKCFLACVARVSVRFSCKQRGTRVTQCYCFLEFQTRAPKNSGTLYPRLSRLLLKDLFVRIIS